MANFRLNADKAVFDTLNVQAMLNLAIGGVYNAQAPQQVKPPFVVFQMLSKEDENSFNGRYANALYMVKAVSKSPWPKEAMDVDTQIDTLMEDATLTITGYTALHCRRERDLALVEEVDAGETYQHVGGIYRVKADQT